MAEYRYYLIPDFMSHVFPQQFEEQAPTEFFSNTADLMKRYKQLREMSYNNEYTWNEHTNLPYPRLTVGIDRRNPDGAVTIMQVRSGINYLCDDYRGPFADRNDKQLIEMATAHSTFLCCNLLAGRSLQKYVSEHADSLP